MIASVPQPGDNVVALQVSVPLRDEWVAVTKIVFEDGRAMIDGDGVAVVRADRQPFPAASSSVWRMLRLGEFQRELARSVELIGWAVGVEFPAAFVPPTPGRGGYSVAFYAEKAQAFVDALGRRPDAPIAELVARYPGTKASQWRRWLAKAEDLELLVDRPEKGAGRSGGRLTEQAIALLTGRE